MNLKLLYLLLTLTGISIAQHENIPYENVENICETCLCRTGVQGDNHIHHVLNCNTKAFKNILARWPKEFGTNHNDIDIVATFSGNNINLLQQLPATNASLTFSCRHCGIKHLQAPTFMDVPNVKRLDLSWNYLQTEELTPDIFRGPYTLKQYKPIALIDLDISHNQLTGLNKKLFEHTPHLIKLNLNSNKFTILDLSTTLAISGASSLEYLDLSNTGISSIPSDIFKSLINLKTLLLGDNKFKVVPDQLSFMGKTLEILNLAGNPIEKLSEQNFLGLKVLKRLNISDMNALKTIENGTFTRLETLAYLYCAKNPNLEKFDLNGLLHCSNLTHLDLSHCSLTSLSLSVNLTATLAAHSNNENRTLPKPWPMLHSLNTVGNPWLCDCELFETLEFIGSHHFQQDTETRCESPYFFAGARFSNLTAEQICSMQLPKKYQVIDEDPPRFLRKRYIILTAITASVVIILGLLIGFVVAFIRRRLKSVDFGIEPIRYTSVRNSNLSAFTPINANGANQA